LRERAVPNNAQGSHKKWLRYHLYFCRKHHYAEAKRESLGQFLNKLEEERQTWAQQPEASHAITLYHELIDCMGSPDELDSPWKVISPGKAPADSPPSSGPSLDQCRPRRDHNMSAGSVMTARRHLEDHHSASDHRLPRFIGSLYSFKSR
jgi:hypothetical protein